MDKNDLFKERLSETEVEIAGVGTVRVRALSRGEVIAIRKATDTDGGVDGPRTLVIERKMLAMAMVDPTMSEADVQRWQDAAPAGELDPVTDAITQLSGLSDDATKSGVQGDGGE